MRPGRDSSQLNFPCPSSDLAQVEAFLDENPDFFKDYLIRKASRHMIDSWLVAHSLPPGHCLPISPKSGSSTPHTRSSTLTRPPVTSTTDIPGLSPPAPGPLGRGEPLR